MKKTISILLLALVLTGAFLIPAFATEETTEYLLPGSGRYNGYVNPVDNCNDARYGIYGCLLFTDGSSTYSSRYPYLSGARFDSSTNTVAYVLSTRTSTENCFAANYYLYCPYGVTSATFDTSAGWVPTNSTITIETETPAFLINNATSGGSCSFYTSAYRVNPYQFPDGYWIHIKFNEESYTSNVACKINAVIDFSICPQLDSGSSDTPSTETITNPWILAIAFLAIGVLIFCLFIL